ncbi:MAG: HEAT repeat domain-containing protein, partial [Polyangiaceae bacterium]
MTRTTAYARRLALLAVLAFSLSSLVSLFSPLVPTARADSRTDFLVGRLQADDFRVRTNAALALGQTGDAAVVTPLCGALSDSSDVVRQAVAVALQRLAKPAAAGCLKARLSVETSDAVKRQIAKALEASEPSAPDTPAATPRVVADAKYYVAISTITNQTTRPDDEIAQVVGGSVRGKLDELGGYQIAPQSETPDQARASMSKRKLKGYYLAVRV